MYGTNKQTVDIVVNNVVVLIVQLYCHALHINCMCVDEQA